MASALEELSPDYMEAENIKLSLADSLAKPQAFRAIGIDVNYDACKPAGIALPLEFLISGPSATSFRRIYFRRFVPSMLTFTPREGGTHSIVLAELFHNRWFGSLTIDVLGERLARVPL